MAPLSLLGRTDHVFVAGWLDSTRPDQTLAPASVCWIDISAVEVTQGLNEGPFNAARTANEFAEASVMCASNAVGQWKALAGHIESYTIYAQFTVTRCT